VREISYTFFLWVKVEYINHEIGLKFFIALIPL